MLMFLIVIILKEYGGLRYREIARCLCINEGNVKMRICRARKRLSTLLNITDGEKEIPSKPIASKQSTTFRQKAIPFAGMNFKNLKEILSSEIFTSVIVANQAKAFMAWGKKK